MNYFEFYAGDYQRDTAHLSLAEHGAFLMLLSTYYSTELPIPAGNPTLFRLVRAMDENEKAAVISVADRFFPIDASDGMRHNARADREILKARARIDIARFNGKKGGRPVNPDKTQRVTRRDTQRATQPLTQTEPAGKALHTPYTILKEEAEARADARPAKSRGTRLPSDWTPYPELTQWAKAERPDIGLTSEIEKFRDYWAAKAGAGGVKLDWPATFRNWVRNSKSEVSHGNRNTSRKLSAVELVEQAIADNSRHSDSGTLVTLHAR